VGIFGIIAFRFVDHSRQISTAGVHKPRKTLFCTVAQNRPNCGFLVWNILRVDILVERKVTCLLHFCKIFLSMIYAV